MKKSKKKNKKSRKKGKIPKRGRNFKKKPLLKKVKKIKSNKKISKKTPKSLRKNKSKNFKKSLRKIKIKPNFCKINSKSIDGKMDTKSLADEPGIPELDLLYNDVYDYETGNFKSMSENMKKQYKTDLQTFYTALNQMLW